MSEANRPPDDPSVTERKEAYLQKVSAVPVGLAPRSLDEAFRTAEVFAKSNLVPPEFRGNAANCLVAIMAGTEVGLSPWQAVQGTAVINGRPSYYGDTLLAICMAAPVFEWIDEPPAKDGVATCTVKRKGWPNPVTRSFSIEDAKRAHLWGKQGPWTNHPDRMLQMRARAFALRDVFADVLRGIASAEEMLDVANPTITEVKPDPIQAMRNDLACSDDQWENILAAWDELNMPHVRRIIQAKQFTGRATQLLDELISYGATPPTPASIAAPAPEPKVVTKHARKRLAKAKEEGTAPTPSPAAPAPTACEHGVDITEPCDLCISLADELAAQAAPPTSEPESAPPVAHQETAAEYAARRKKELAALNESKVAPTDTVPF